MLFCGRLQGGLQLSHPLFLPGVPFVAAYEFSQCLAPFTVSAWNALRPPLRTPGSAGILLCGQWAVGSGQRAAGCGLWLRAVSRARLIPLMPSSAPFALPTFRLGASVPARLAFSCPRGASDCSRGVSDCPRGASDCPRGVSDSLVFENESFCRYRTAYPKSRFMKPQVD